MQGDSSSKEEACQRIYNGFLRKFSRSISNASISAAASEGIVSPVIWAMNHTYNFVAGQNNGNVPKITDQLTSSRTQTFGYDSFASHTYQYDGESRLKSLDSGSSVKYVYDADNTRIVKQVGSDTAEYVVANGQSLSEHHSANWNDWSDRVYLGGRLLAKADSYEDRILITGSTAGNQYSLFAFPSAGGYAGYVMRSGDKLFLRQYQTSGSHGGIQVAFTDGTNTNWNVNDQDCQQINNDGTSGSWHYRRFDLSSYAGKTISQIYLVQEISTTANPWSIYCTDISMLSLDGSVRPLYNRETSIALSHSGNSTGTASINHVSNSVLSPDTTTTFYHGDHLGSSRIMSSVNGYPVWQATYLPFGYEYNPQITVNHFKFTGKERDSESGLDNFGARYHASNMGRFMSPDWSAKIEPVPYSKLDDPQSLNLYSYVLNNPLSNVDTDGHACSALLGNSDSGFCQRAREYGKIDGYSGIESQTRFFAAASAVSQALADVDAWSIGSRPAVSQQTATFLEGMGLKLEAVNEGEAHLIPGTLNGPGLDKQLVHNEQSAVQGQLDSLKQSNPAAYAKAISEINGALNSNGLTRFFSDNAGDKDFNTVLDGVRKDLGRKIDFSNESDREAIGNALIKRMRQKAALVSGGCPAQYAQCR